MSRMHEQSIRDEFTHQTDSFARSPVMSSAETLDALVAMAPADEGGRWLEVACGPALIARTLAGRVGSVHGVDLTPAMVAKAGEEAATEGVDNAEFSVGDATALEFADGSFDGAITRFSLHHIPAPKRVLEEMARVVRPGGLVIVGDHMADDDADVTAWAEEIERLRDPSHWACLTPARLNALAAGAGLELDLEELLPLDLDFGEWLGRGSGGPDAAALIERLLSEAPPNSDAFRVTGEGAERRLKLHYALSRWRRP
jgi:SAM-dependent methyltransferase